MKNMNHKLNIKTFNNQNKNKTITHSFFKIRNLLLNKTKNEIKEQNEYESKNNSPNSFRKGYLKFTPKLNKKEINNKTTKTLTKILEQPKLIKIKQHKNLSNDKNNLRHKNKYIDNFIKRNNISINSHITNTNTYKYLDTINNISTDINSKVNSNNTNNNYNSGSKKKKNNLFFPINRNAINFMDRNKLKATKTINLKLFEKFEEEINKMNDNNKNGKIQINNNHFLDSEEFLIYNSLKTLPQAKNEKIYKKMLKVSNNTSTNNHKFHKIKKEINNILENNKIHKTKYSLKKLMELNPYHSVPKNVKYCDLVEIKNISEQLSHVSGVTHTRASTSKRHFFLNDINIENTKNKDHNLKIINSVTVTFNNKYSSRKGELVWRILQKLKKTIISNSFRQACIFQGYSELWKYYGITIEKMLVNYTEYKWFITKDKYMEKQVFTEFLQYLDINIKENKLFPDKVYLLFDYTGTDKINIKIFYFIMELISNSKDIDKINFIIELCEDNSKQNYISVMEFQEIFKYIILYDNYQKDNIRLNEIIKNEFNVDKIESSLYITKPQLFNFLISNEFVKKLIFLFKNQFRNAYYYYNEEINSSFNSTVRNVKTFLNEQNEVNIFCKHDIVNYEQILKSIQNKRKTIENNKIRFELFDKNNQ